MTLPAVPVISHWNLNLLPDVQNSDATNHANIVTIGAYGATASVQQLAGMHYPRAYCTSVVLPDGKVLTMGGQVTSEQCLKLFVDAGCACKRAPSVGIGCNWPVRIAERCTGMSQCCTRRLPPAVCLLLTRGCMRSCTADDTPDRADQPVAGCT